MPEPALTAARRTITGKKVKTLRAQGLLPANLYGRGLDSIALQADAKDFSHFIRSDAVRGVFALQVDGEAATRPVILRGMTRAGGTGEPMHAEFFQVDMTREVEVTVPLRLVNESPAVRDLAGSLIQARETVRVRCLPGDIPAAIDVDLSGLETFASAILVGDLARGAAVTVTSPPSLLVVSVSPPRAARGS